jgi:hypothetical protein
VVPSISAGHNRWDGELFGSTFSMAAIRGIDQAGSCENSYWYWVRYYTSDDNVRSTQLVRAKKHLPLHTADVIRQHAGRCVATDDPRLAR